MLESFNPASRLSSVRCLSILMLTFDLLAFPGSLTQGQDIQLPSKPEFQPTKNEKAPLEAGTSEKLVAKKGILLVWYSSAVTEQQLKTAETLIEEAREQKGQGRIGLTIIDVSDLNRAYGGVTASTLLKVHFGPNADGALFQIKQGAIYLERYMPITPEKWAVKGPEAPYPWESIQNYLQRSENPFSNGGKLAMGWRFEGSEPPAAENGFSFSNSLPSRTAMLVLWSGAAILVGWTVSINLRRTTYPFSN